MVFKCNTRGQCFFFCHGHILCSAILSKLSFPSKGSQKYSERMANGIAKYVLRINHQICPYTIRLPSVCYPFAIPSLCHPFWVSDSEICLLLVTLQDNNAWYSLYAKLLVPFHQLGRCTAAPRRFNSIEL